MSISFTDYMLPSSEIAAQIALVLQGSFMTGPFDNNTENYLTVTLQTSRTNADNNSVRMVCSCGNCIVVSVSIFSISEYGSPLAHPIAVATCTAPNVVHQQAARILSEWLRWEDTVSVECTIANKFADRHHHQIELRSNTSRYACGRCVRCICSIPALCTDHLWGEPLYL